MSKGRRSYAASAASIDRIDFRLLRAFTTVAKTGNYSQAAQELGYTEPAVHLQVKALGEAIGGTLFARSSGRMHLTELGQAILPVAHEALKRLAALVDTAENYHLNVSKRLRVGVGRWTGDYVTAPILDAFAESHPDIACEWKSAPPREVIAGVKRGDLDVGLAFALRGEVSGNLVALTWRRYRLNLYATRSLWLAAQTEGFLRIGFPGTPQYPDHPTPPDRPQWADVAQAISCWCRTSRISAELVPFDSIEAAKAVAVAGQMASCLPEFAVISEVAGGGLFPLTFAERDRDFPIDVVHQRPSRNDAVGQFIRFLRQHKRTRMANEDIK